MPAVWSDAAKNATLRVCHLATSHISIAHLLTVITSQAAEAAGISPVTLIKEPEAAALYTAKSLAFCMKPNHAFIICDAGGGTVDLVSYEVESILPRLQVKELVPGTGKLHLTCILVKR